MNKFQIFYQHHVPLCAGHSRTQQITSTFPTPRPVPSGPSHVQLLPPVLPPVLTQYCTLGGKHGPGSPCVIQVFNYYQSLEETGELYCTGDL